MQGSNARGGSRAAAATSSAKRSPMTNAPEADRTARRRSSRHRVLMCSFNSAMSATRGTGVANRRCTARTPLSTSGFSWACAGRQNLASKV
jgi:hypothetical protein